MGPMGMIAGHAVRFGFRGFVAAALPAAAGTAATLATGFGLLTLGSAVSDRMKARKANQGAQPTGPSNHHEQPAGAK